MIFFFFQAEDGIRDLVRSRGLGDVYKRQIPSGYIDSGRLSVARLGENQGIAAALNIGVEEAIRGGARYVLLSDQDSLPDADMVERLISCLLYTSDAADERSSVDLGGRRIIKKKKKK